MTRSATLLSVLSAALVLSACASDPLKAYPEAGSVRDCEVLAEADENARKRSMNAQPSSGNWLADALAGGVGAGVLEAGINSRLAGCIQRVTGQAPASGSLTAAPLGSAPDREALLADTSAARGQQAAGGQVQGFAQCTRGGGVLQGGSQYCLGQ